MPAHIVVMIVFLNVFVCGGVVGVMDRENTTTSLGELGFWEPNEGPFQ